MLWLRLFLLSALYFAHFLLKMEMHCSSCYYEVEYSFISMRRNFVLASNSESRMESDNSFCKCSFQSRFSKLFDTHLVPFKCNLCDTGCLAQKTGLGLTIFNSQLFQQLLFVPKFMWLSGKVTGLQSMVTPHNISFKECYVLTSMNIESSLHRYIIPMYVSGPKHRLI